MNYEEKYNEILEWARKNKARLNGVPIEEVLPELTESEDERIRKAILGLTYLDGIEPILTKCSITAGDIRTYLEKQKENNEYVFRPLAGTDITIAAEQAIRRANEGECLLLAFNGAYIPVRKGVSANKIVDIYDAFVEKQKENRMQPVYDNQDSFESALEKAWKSYNESAARTVDSCEDDYVECAHAKGFREGYLFGLEKQKEPLRDFIDDFPYSDEQQEQKPAEVDESTKRLMIIG